jgi:hypothetical protein
MQPMNESQLKQIITDAEKQGKDVSDLKAELEQMSAPRAMAKPIILPMGEIQEKKTDRGTMVIQSTGPAREEDFK